MKIAIVNFASMSENNPTLCTSAARYTGDCLFCERMKLALQGHGYDILKAITSLSCTPIISDNQMKLWKLKEAHLKKIQNLKNKIAKIDTKLEKLYSN